MHFLPDVYVQCDVCKGKRYNRETLEIKFRDKSIADVLAMTVEEGAEFFSARAGIRDKLKILQQVGLGYIQLGQQATTLSGGEAQRIKLSKELARRATGRTLYILDEPTTGLHFEDVRKLLEVLHALVDQGNTVRGDRAQSGSHQDRRLDHRSRSRGRRRRRPHRGRGHARADRRGEGQLHRPVPRAPISARNAAKKKRRACESVPRAGVAITVTRCHIGSMPKGPRGARGAGRRTAAGQLRYEGEMSHAMPPDLPPLPRCPLLGSRS